MFSDLLALFFPKTCEGCNGALVKKEDILCTQCLHDLPRTESHQCTVEQLSAKFYGKIETKYLWSFLYFRKNSVVQKMLHKLKYGNKPEIGHILGKLFALDIKNFRNDYRFDSIIPVPLHRSRQKRRGYNQSEHFANGMSEILGIAVDIEVIRRIKKSQTQTNKSRMERWENVSEIFKVEKRIEGKSVLLVDDVITTGSTLEACYHKLMEAGAKEISIATIALAV